MSNTLFTAAVRDCNQVRTATTVNSAAQVDPLVILSGPESSNGSFMFRFLINNRLLWLFTIYVIHFRCWLRLAMRSARLIKISIRSTSIGCDQLPDKIRSDHLNYIYPLFVEHILDFIMRNQCAPLVIHDEWIIIMYFLCRVKFHWFSPSVE